MWVDRACVRGRLRLRSSRLPSLPREGLAGLLVAPPGAPTEEFAAALSGLVPLPQRNTVNDALQLPAPPRRVLDGQSSFPGAPAGRRVAGTRRLRPGPTRAGPRGRRPAGDRAGGLTSSPVGATGVATNAAARLTCRSTGRGDHRPGRPSPHSHPNPPLEGEGFNAGRRGWRGGFASAGAPVDPRRVIDGGKSGSDDARRGNVDPKRVIDGEKSGIDGGWRGNVAASRAVDGEKSGIDALGPAALHQNGADVRSEKATLRLGGARVAKKAAALPVRGPALPPFRRSQWRKKRHRCG